MDRQKKSRHGKIDEFIGVLNVHNASLDFQEPLKGSFAKGRSGLCFELKERPGVPQIRLPFCISSDPEAKAKYEPLFSFLEDKSLPVVLYGKYLKKHEVFAIYTLDLEEDEKPSFFSATPYTSSFIRAVVDRLKTSDIHGSALERFEPDTTFTKVEELKAYFSICKETFPPWVSRAVQRDMNRLGALGSSSESTKHAQKALRYWFSINWDKQDLHVPGVMESKAILDRMFYGLDEVKRRILEIVAQIRHTGELPLWGVLLNGPAGTGKTSIAKAIAVLLGMPVIRLDLSTIGGHADELAGSSRIYGNAQPGAILAKMLEAKSSTGVLLINEIDKASTDGRNEGPGCADALLTLLDRQGFYENFLEESIPTDGLFAVATCNDASALSKPLLDRFLVIDIPGYSPEEKEVIWKDYVLPSVTDRLKLKREQLRFTQEAADELIHRYAVDPGVRDLEQYTERFAGALCIMLGRKGSDYCHTFTLDELRKLLGPPRKIKKLQAMNLGEVNVAFCSGGCARVELLEAAITSGRGEFRVLGPVPELQREYIRAAYECVRNTTGCDVLDKDVTVFLPKPIPPDFSNQVGCAAYAAIFSLLMQPEMDLDDIAFVGGVDLNGNLYLDTSDLRPLLKAAKEANIKTLYAPVGVSELMRQSADEKDAITVVESQNAELLLTIAMSASRRN